MNLFWKESSGEYQPCQLAPFSHEEALETLVFKNANVLGSIFPLHRQVQGGNKPGIPDIIGIDDEGSICIIELKNVPVDASILPQVLEYAIWAETHPDSIKNLWLTCRSRPEDLDPTFENYSVRIIVVAPQIDPSVVHHMDKLKINVDLIELNRYKVAGQDILSVNRLQAPSKPKPRPVAGMGVYDQAFYEKDYNKASAGHFFEYVEAARQIVEREGWPLELKLNKGYAVFKNGFSQAFGITWLGSKNFALFFKLTKEEAVANTPSHVSMTKYEEGWKYAAYKVEPGKTEIQHYLALMQASVEKLVGA